MFGHVETVNVMEDSRSGRSRGFAYVTFAEADVAEKVARELFFMNSNCVWRLVIQSVSLNQLTYYLWFNLIMFLILAFSSTIYH